MALLFNYTDETLRNERPATDFSDSPYGYTDAHSRSNSFPLVNNSPQTGPEHMFVLVASLNTTMFVDNVTESAERNVTSAGNGTGNEAAVGAMALTMISILFCIIGVVGIAGNTMIIFIVAVDRKMRRSATNLYIMNLAISDLLIMLCGVPETVQFVINRGWLLGEVLCKLERYLLVVSLYSSVLTLVSVCIERYIAIVHPMKAHLWCSRRRTAGVLGIIWPCCLLLGVPVALYNRLVPKPGTHIAFCSIHFPGDHIRHLVIFKYSEFVVFYLIPMVIQVTCYSVIGRHLFASSEQLHRKQMVRSESGAQRERMSEAMRARKGVVKMLIASVFIYFVSYSPHQILLFYNTFSHAPFHQTWVFVVFVTAMAYINSTSNPILYCIFSNNFRQKFKRILTACFPHKDSGIPLNYVSQTEASAAGGAPRYMYVRVPAASTNFTGNAV